MRASADSHCHIDLESSTLTRWNWTCCRVHSPANKSQEEQVAEWLQAEVDCFMQGGEVLPMSGHSFKRSTQIMDMI